MKIGLTGATGFIGQTFIENCPLQYDIVAATSGKSRPGERVNYIHVDYSLEESLENAFLGCSAILHLGAKIQHNKADVQQTLNLYLDNIISTENVFSACKSLGIKNLIFTSSTTVYEKRADTLYDEDSITNPLNPYGISKVCCEKLANLYNQKYQMHIKCLRLAYVYGNNKNALAQGQLPVLYLNKAAAYEPLPVYGRGVSSNVYVYVKDVVTALLRSIDKPSLSGIFNIGNKESTSNLQLATAFKQVFDNKSEILMLKDKPETGLQWRISTLKAEQQLDFLPQFSLLAAIYDMKCEKEKKGWVRTNAT